MCASQALSSIKYTRLKPPYHLSQKKCGRPEDFSSRPHKALIYSGVASSKINRLHIADSNKPCPVIRMSVRMSKVFLREVI